MAPKQILKSSIRLFFHFFNKFNLFSGKTLDLRDDIFSFIKTEVIEIWKQQRSELKEHAVGIFAQEMGMEGANPWNPGITNHQMYTILPE